MILVHGQRAGKRRVIGGRNSKVRYDYAGGAAAAIIMGIVELVVISAVLGLRSLLYTGSTSGGKG